MEISKYDSIYKELNDKTNILSLMINDSLQNEHVLYNTTFIINEDLESFKNEIYLYKKNIDNLKDTIINIEQSYPLEFAFLLEDIILEKEQNQIIKNKS